MVDSILSLDFALFMLFVEMTHELVWHHAELCHRISLLGVVGVGVVVLCGGCGVVRGRVWGGRYYNCVLYC